jgi:hypothetical protein
MGCSHTGTGAGTGFEGNRVRVQTRHAYHLHGEAQVLRHHLPANGIKTHPSVGYRRGEGAPAGFIHRDPGNWYGPPLWPLPQDDAPAKARGLRRPQLAASATRCNVSSLRT